MSGCHDTNEPSYTFQLRQEINAWKAGIESYLNDLRKAFKDLTIKVNTHDEQNQNRTTALLERLVTLEKINNRVGELEMTVRANSDRLFTERHTYGRMLNEKIIERVGCIEGHLGLHFKKTDDSHVTDSMNMVKDHNVEIDAPHIECVSFDNMQDALNFFADKHKMQKMMTAKPHHPSRQHLEKKLREKNLLIKELEAKLVDKSEKLSKAINDLNGAINNDRESRQSKHQLALEFERRSQNQAVSLRQMQDKITRLETALKGFLTVDPKEFTHATEKREVEKDNSQEHRYRGESRETS